MYYFYLQLLKRFQIGSLQLTGTILTDQKIIAYLLIGEAGENVLHNQQITDLGSLSKCLGLVILRTIKISNINNVNSLKH